MSNLVSIWITDLLVIPDAEIVNLRAVSQSIWFRHIKLRVILRKVWINLFFPAYRLISEHLSLNCNLKYIFCKCLISCRKWINQFILLLFLFYVPCIFMMWVNMAHHKYLSSIDLSNICFMLSLIIFDLSTIFTGLL